jgi:predicted membrane-bound dolichyl-phosphate-mannose-protein mannosyltransferase
MNKHIVFIILLTVVSFFIRLYKLDVPDRQIGDEVYYVPDAKSILGQNERGLPIDPRYGHPPLGKMLIALGMLVFGDNPFGWRIMSAVAGTIAIPIFYLVVSRLFQGRKEYSYATPIATFLFSFETLTFYFSRVARIDIFMLVFLLAGIYFLLDDSLKRKILAAPLFAASFLAKESALVVIVPLLLYTGWKTGGKTRKKERSWFRRFDWKTVLTLFTATGVSAAALWYVLEWVILVPRSSNLVERVLLMLSRLSISNPTAAGRSEIWQWFFNYPVTRAVAIVPGYQINPATVVTGPLVTPGLRYSYVIQVSWTVLAFMVPAMLYMLWIARKDALGRFTSLYWFGGLMGWVIVNMAFRGLIYLFYILTILPPVIIAISYFLGKRLYEESSGKSVKWTALTGLYLLLHLLYFAALYPVPLL